MVVIYNIGQTVDEYLHRVIVISYKINFLLHLDKLKDNLSTRCDL